eukprot:2669928-Pleurochrysis_carterae.AAC.2
MRQYKLTECRPRLSLPKCLYSARRHRGNRTCVHSAKLEQLMLCNAQSKEAERSRKTQAEAGGLAKGNAT